MFLQVVSTSGGDNTKASSHNGSVGNNSSTNSVSVANGDSVNREDSGTGEILFSAHFCVLVLKIYDELILFILLTNDFLDAFAIGKIEFSTQEIVGRGSQGTTVFK